MGASQLIGTAARIPERIGRRVSNSPVDAVASASPESARPFPGHDPASPVAGSEPARRLKSFPIPAPSLLQHQFQDRRLRWPTRPLILRARLMRRPLAASVCGGNPMKPTSGFSAIWAQPASALRMTQVEVMTHADRLIAMNGGVAEKIGTPLDGCAQSATMLVAGFVGSPAMNF